MADIQEQYDLANDNFFRTVLDTGAVLRLATVIALNGDGSLSVDIADEDGSLIDVWPLDGKLFAEGAIVYVLLFHSRGVGLALGVAKGPYPEIDISQIPDAVALTVGVRKMISMRG